MKQIIVGLVFFFALLLAYNKLAGPLSLSVTSVTTQKTDTFSVTGQGKVTVSPDLALLMAGVQSQGPTVKASQEALNTKINQIITAIKGLGINSKDLQTGNYSIQPMYDFSLGPQRITGYQASSNLTIKVRELDKANSVIDAATAAGANQIGGINFTVDDPTKAQNDARVKAVAEAKRKAEDASRIAGFKLGRIINYSEDFGNNPRPLPMMAAADKAGGAAPTQLEPGSNEIVVNVTLSYEID